MRSPESLSLLNFDKEAVSPAELHALQTAVRDVFFVSTCQRLLLIGESTQIESLKRVHRNGSLVKGSEAYAFLLRIACGLESKVIGETEILGQLHAAWEKWIAETGDERLRGHLEPWFSRLFQEARQIRTYFLQGVGAHSYGSLVRKLIGAAAPDRILMVGAGQLAASVLPFLLKNQVLLYNRTRHHLEAQLQKLIVPPQKVPAILEEEDLAQALLQVEHLVLCIPAEGAVNDRLANLRRGQIAARGKTIHLGAISENCGAWNLVPNFYSLTEIFQMQKTLGQKRQREIYRARKACFDFSSFSDCLKSRRELAWDDLAEFAY